MTSRLRGSEMTKIFRKSYPRQSRFKGKRKPTA
ncbi:DUF4014 family protein, partial [Salmonella enterica]